MNTGNVAILNCADGDTRLTFNTRNKDDVKRTKSIVEDMLRRGYTIVVDIGDGQFERVTEFDPGMSEYIVQETGPASASGSEPAPQVEPSSAATDHRARPRRRLKARDTKAYAVAPTAGGGFGTRAHRGPADCVPASALVAAIATGGSK